MRRVRLFDQFWPSAVSVSQALQWTCRFGIFVLQVGSVCLRAICEGLVVLDLFSVSA